MKVSISSKLEKKSSMEMRHPHGNNTFGLNVGSYVYDSVEEHGGMQEKQDYRQQQRKSLQSNLRLHRSQTAQGYQNEPKSAFVVTSAGMGQLQHTYTQHFPEVELAPEKGGATPLVYPGAKYLHSGQILAQEKHLGRREPSTAGGKRSKYKKAASVVPNSALPKIGQRAMSSEMASPIRPHWQRSKTGAQSPFWSPGQPNYYPNDISQQQELMRTDQPPIKAQGSFNHSTSQPGWAQIETQDSQLAPSLKQRRAQQSFQQIQLILQFIVDQPGGPFFSEGDIINYLLDLEGVTIERKQQIARYARLTKGLNDRKHQGIMDDELYQILENQLTDLLEKHDGDLETVLQELEQEQRESMGMHSQQVVADETKQVVFEPVPDNLATFGGETGDIDNLAQVLVQPNDFIFENKGNIKDFYRIGQKIGAGTFAQVRLCINKSTGAQRALKIITKNRFNPDQEAILENEVNIHKQLDHPNIIKLYEYFRDENRMYMILEICSGGELHEKIKNQIRFNEYQTRIYMQQILKTVSYLHHKGLVHRDIKTENILIDGSDNSIKIIDFGLSKFIEEGEKCTDRQGTPYYLAPEVLIKNYDRKCDIWSCGIVMYIMLSGRPPFNAESDLEIMRLIKIGDFAMSGKVWNNVSQQAKSLITKMLEYDPKRRWTATQCLEHDWFYLGVDPDTQFDRQGQKNQAQLGNDNLKLGKQQILNFLANMKTFKVTQKLKQASYAYIVTHLLTKRDKKPLARLFSEINTNHNGHLTKDELNFAFQKYFGSAIEKEEIDKMFAVIDASGSGQIEYSEFMVACIPEKILLTNENMAVVFKVFDDDGSGVINHEEIKRVMSLSNKNITDHVARQIMDQIDADGDGDLNFEEFSFLMKNLLQ